jgi:hypothetical protein
MLLRKFGLVVWKNLLLRKRHWIVTSLEIVIPVVLFILAAVVKTQLSPDVIEVSAKYGQIQNEDNMTTEIYDFCNKSVLYAPNKTFESYIMGNVTSNGKFFGK